jgi:hypothetical protein
MASLRDDSAYVPLELWLPTSVGLASTALQAGRGEVTSIAQEGAQQSAIAATYLVHGRFALVVAIMNGSQMRAPAILTEVLKRLSL